MVLYRPHDQPYKTRGRTMKFGQNLLRVAEASDPAWAPFWINYKLLKVGIKRR